MTDLSPDVEALLDESYESDLTEEESEELLLLCGHGIGPKLSPAAQAVLDAFLFNWQDNPLDQDRLCLAAALRAAADQLTPYSVEDVPGAAFCRNKILAIATELEGNNG